MSAWTETAGTWTRHHRGERIEGPLMVRPARAGGWAGIGPKGDLLTPRAAFGRLLAEQKEARWATEAEAMAELDERFRERA